jgi:hypothetical protein
MLSDQHIHAFHEDGLTVLRQVWPCRQIAALADHALRVMFRHLGEGLPHVDGVAPLADTLQLRNAWQLDDLIRGLVLSRSLAAIAGGLLGASGIQLYGDLIVVKEPGAPESPWHADRVFMPVAPEGLVVACVPLHPCGPDGPGLRFRPSSHRLLPTTFRNPQSPVALRRFSRRLDAARCPIAEPTLQPGDVVFYTASTAHRNGANRSRRPVASLYVIYLAEGQTLKRPRTRPQARERERHFANIGLGRAIVTPLNPLLWRKPTDDPFALSEPT